ncbi:hypothetical protein [Nocardioides terrae]|uniref:hypothetical protein n=1 Tax=Nocardioides terrae TaxID=574651 RepID=UPI0011132D93|nr:hypothetical protein [Nocardioides terrae]
MTGISGTVVAVLAYRFSVRTYEETGVRWKVAMGDRALILSHGDRFAGFVVEVINTGRMPGAIQDVKVCTTDGWYSASFRSGGDACRIGAQLPMTMEPTAKASWFFDASVIDAAVDAQARDRAPLIYAVLESGGQRITTNPPVSVGRKQLPPARQPKPKGRWRHWLRHPLWSLRSRRPSRRPAVQVWPAGFDLAMLDKGLFPIALRNFGKGTARNLRLDMVRNENGVETTVPDVAPRHLKRLKGESTHTFMYPIDEATRPAQDGVEFWWRLSSGQDTGRPGYGVLSRGELEQAHASLRESATSTGEQDVERGLVAEREMPATDVGDRTGE